MDMITKEEIQKIISDQDSAKLMVKKAEQIGISLQKRGLKTAQIRAIFGEVRQIQSEWSINPESRARALRKLTLLKPKMAYRAKKEFKESHGAVQSMVDVLEPALDVVINGKTDAQQDICFKQFVEFFEAILAYHKASGGS